MKILYIVGILFLILPGSFAVDIFGYDIPMTIAETHQHIHAPKSAATNQKLEMVQINSYNRYLEMTNRGYKATNPVTNTATIDDTLGGLGGFLLGLAYGL